MEEKNLKVLMEETSDKLLETKYLIEIISGLTEGSDVSDGAISTLIDMILKNTLLSFKNIEECRKIFLYLD